MNVGMAKFGMSLIVNALVQEYVRMVEHWISLLVCALVQLASLASTVEVSLFSHFEGV